MRSSQNRVISHFTMSPSKLAVVVLVIISLFWLTTSQTEGSNESEIIASDPTTKSVLMTTILKQLSQLIRELEEFEKVITRVEGSYHDLIQNKLMQEVNKWAQLKSAIDRYAEGQEKWDDYKLMKQVENIEQIELMLSKLQTEHNEITLKTEADAKEVSQMVLNMMARYAESAIDLNTPLALLNFKLLGPSDEGWSSYKGEMTLEDALALIEDLIMEVTRIQNAFRSGLDDGTLHDWLSIHGLPLETAGLVLSQSFYHSTYKGTHIQKTLDARKEEFEVGIKNLDDELNHGKRKLNEVSGKKLFSRTSITLNLGKLLTELSDFIRHLKEFVDKFNKICTTDPYIPIIDKLVPLIKKCAEVKETIDLRMELDRHIGGVEKWQESFMKPLTTWLARIELSMYDIDAEYRRALVTTVEIAEEVQEIFSKFTNSFPDDFFERLTAINVKVLKIQWSSFQDELPPAPYNGQMTLDDAAILILQLENDAEIKIAEDLNAWRNKNSEQLHEVGLVLSQAFYDIEKNSTGLPENIGSQKKKFEGMMISLIEEMTVLQETVNEMAGEEIFYSLVQRKRDSEKWKMENLDTVPPPKEEL